VKALAAAVLALTAISAQALEPFQRYDDFKRGPIDMNRWLDSERIRTIRNGELRLMQRSYGTSAVDFGATFLNWNESMVNPNAITAIKARIRVNAVEVNACPANLTSVAQSRARIIGGFFNVGFPIPNAPGSLIGDVIAQVRITRFANSVDPAGVLRVQGFATRCTTVDCVFGVGIGPLVDLGTVNLGESTSVQLEWDRAGKRFNFSRDHGAYSGFASYAELGLDDSLPANNPFKQVSTRVEIPNCSSGPLSATVDAAFDKVSVNQSAAPVRVERSHHDNDDRAPD
jgi:hypothetical protein